ncbi:MAG: HlyD family type I secretion periplasmic adaptor subunit [Pseudomonadota bacterium]
MNRPQTPPADRDPMSEILEDLHKETPDVGPALIKRTRPVLIVGLAVFLGFFGIGGLWATTAPLSSAAVVPGFVSPEGSRKTIQHLEGGIIAEVRVEEGDFVRQGDPLVVLQDIGAGADVKTLTGRLERLTARSLRLEAERAGAEEVIFDDPLLRSDERPDLVKLLADQRRQFTVRQESTQGQIEVLRSQIQQFGQQIEGYNQERRGVTRQSDLIQEEIVAVESLFRKGLEEKPRLLALKRRKAELDSLAGRLQAEMARAREAVNEAEIQIIAIRTERDRRVEEEFEQVDAERREVEEQLLKLDDILQRTEIRAPASGRVLNLAYRTPGGVVPPGGALLEIVPKDAELIIEGRLSPQDVDSVGEGFEAQVYFPSLPSRNQPRLSATVKYLSADKVEDQRTGEIYYKVWLEVPEAERAKIIDLAELIPGMPAETYIFTGQQTLFEYLTSPLVNSVRRSFREG